MLLVDDVMYGEWESQSILGLCRHFWRIICHCLFVICQSEMYKVRMKDEWPYKEKLLTEEKEQYTTNLKSMIGLRLAMLTE